MDPAGSSINFNSADAQTPHSSISPPSSSAPGPTRTKRRRNTSAGPGDCCRTCRLRKVKCTGVPASGGACSNCARLDLACTFVEIESAGEQGVARTTPSRSHTEAGTVRKRAQRACSQCHAHKTKCSGGLPKCKRCEASGLVCEYIPAKRKFANVQFNVNSASEDRDLPILPATTQNDTTTSVPAPAQSVQTSAQAPQPASHSHSSVPTALETSNFSGEAFLLRKDIIQTHMTVYFDEIYHLPCYGFLHPKTTRESIQENRFNSGLAAAVCSLTSWLLNPGQEGRDFARRCNEHVDFQIFQSTGDLSELYLTLLTMANLYNWIDGQIGKMWMYSAQASRLVHALQLNWDSESPSGQDGFIRQEIRRRLTWQTYITDRLLSGGFEEHTLCRDETMYLRLPCDEDSFQENQPVNMERLDQKPRAVSNGRPNLNAYHIRMISIRHQILGTTKKYIRNAKGNLRIEPSQVMEDVNKLQLRISSLVEALPVSTRLSDPNIDYYFNRQERSSFVMLHTWIGQLHVDLYRFSLPDIREQASDELLMKLPSDFVSKSQKQAIAHAITLSRFWEHMFRLIPASSFPPVISTDFMVSVCIIHTSMVLLVARKHCLYTNLNENSTAPLWRSEDINDEVINRLLQSNLEVLRGMAEFLPRVKKYETELLKKFEQFAQWQDDEKARVGFPSVSKDSQSMRLPGPHVILENALLKENNEPPPRNTYQDNWVQQVQGMQIFPPEKQIEFCYGPPRLPALLEQARGFRSAPQPPSQPELMSQPPYMDNPMTHARQDMNRIVPATNYGMMPQEVAHQAPIIGEVSSLGLSSPPNHGSYGLPLLPHFQDYGTLHPGGYQDNSSNGYNQPPTRFGE